MEVVFMLHCHLNKFKMLNMIYKILLVEDEVLMARMYQDKLESAGFDVFWVMTSEQALDSIKKQKPDLIVLDILLPTENGIFCLRKIKDNNDFKNIPVIAFSNYDEVKAKKEVLELGAEAYLLKTDFTPNKLVKEIQKYLRG